MGRLPPVFPMTPRLKKFLQRLAVLVVVVGIVILGAFFVAPRWLIVETTPSPADAIIVLGGDTNARPARAAELFHQGIAPRVIVSGIGDDGVNRHVLTNLGVTAAAVQREADSLTTKQNAEFSVRLLRVEKATNVVIVTSWYHSRRALACFRKVAPEIQFHSCPTVADRPRILFPDKYDRSRVLMEYLKVGYYWFVHGIRPW